MTNTIDLPTTWQEWVELFIQILAGGAEMTVRNPWLLAIAITFVVALAAAWSAPHGTDLNSPILSEDDRKAAR